MISNLCFKCKIFPSQHYCSLCKTMLVCTMYCLERELVEIVFVCIPCNENRKNDTKSVALGSLKVSSLLKISQNNHFSLLIPSTTCAQNVRYSSSGSNASNAITVNSDEESNTSSNVDVGMLRRAMKRKEKTMKCYSISKFLSGLNLH